MTPVRLVARRGMKMWRSGKGTAMNSHSTLILVLALGALLPVRTNAEQPKQQAGLSLTINSENRKVVPGALVVIHIALQNDSDKVYIFSATDPLRSFHFTVKDSDGHLMPPTRYFRIADFVAQSASVAETRIRPGEAISVTVAELNRLFDMSAAGEYEVTVTMQEFMPGAEEVKVTSNTLKLSIVEPDGYRIAKYDGPPKAVPSLQEKRP